MIINSITFTSKYGATLEQNAEYLRQIVPLMSEKKVSIDPLSFTLFYDYIAGKNINLNNELKDLFGNKTIFTPELCIKLFKKHICDTSVDSLEKINQTLLELINTTSEAVEATGEKASAATLHFQNHSKKLENNNSLANIKTVLTEIIAETQDLAETSRMLQMRLDESNKEMQMLRQDLAVAHETAKTDALTGLLNRRAFDQKLDLNIETHKQSNVELCLLMLDLDYFKKINDTFGHQVGDNVLRYTANLMKQHIAEHHHAARYGGEEMAIIMPNTSFDKAMEIAEKIRSSLAKHPLKRKDSKESIGTVTVSIGVSSFKQNDSISSLIERADQAMYRAKTNGRNQVMAECFV